MNGTSIILRKELKRVFGDRKLIFSLFILPAILVIAIYGLMGKMIGSMEEDIVGHISNVYIVNSNDSLESVLKAVDYSAGAEITRLSNSEYAAQKDELAGSMREGNIDLIVVLDETFEAKVAAYTQVGDAIPEIAVLYNSTENYSGQAYSVFVGTVLNYYREALLANRLGNLEVLNVFTERDELIIKEEKANTEFISMMLPYLITMMLFAGAMSLGVDAIAGEKERGTLASMLLTPVRRRDIVLGKLIALSILSGLSALVYAGSMIIAMPFMGNSMGDMAESGFGGLTLSITESLQLLAIMLVMVYLFVALIGLLATIAKDTKAASTYLSPAYIVVILSGMLTMFTTGKEVPTYRYLIPVYGNALAIKDLCAHELTAGNFGISLAGTVVIATVLTLAIARAFNNEKIMFNA